MIETEKLEKQIAGLQQVTFRAALGKTQGKITLCPLKSKITGQFMGVERLTDEQKRKSIRVIDESTERDVFDGFTLNLNDAIDKIDWEWMKYAPELVATLEDSYESPIALFYIENLEADTDIRIKARNIKKKAFEYISNASQTKQVEICRLLGIDASVMKPKDIEDYLGEMADNSPRKIVDAFEDVLVKVKLFLYALLDKKVVIINGDGIYQWGGLILGINEKSALTWLQVPTNAGYVKRLRDLVYPIHEVQAPEISPESDFSLDPHFSVEPIKFDLKNISDDETAQIKEEYKKVFGKLPPHLMKPQTMIDKINLSKEGQEEETEI